MTKPQLRHVKLLIAAQATVQTLEVMAKAYAYAPDNHATESNTRTQQKRTLDDTAAPDDALTAKNRKLAELVAEQCHD